MLQTSSLPLTTTCWLSIPTYCSHQRLRSNPILPADQRGLLAVFERISNQEEAAAALEAVAELRRHRAHQQQHSLFHQDKMDAFFRVRVQGMGL